MSTPYDDVFRTILNDCRELILPVLNEVFGETYTGQETIEFSPNEIFLSQQDGVQEKRVTDSCFVVRADHSIVRYHLECESSPDQSVVVRIFEYDAQIALNDHRQDGYKLTVSFPHTAVIALRSRGTMPEQMEIELCTPGGNISYFVPILKSQRYTIQEIFEKNLLFLIPFYIFSHESHFDKYDRDPDALNQMLGEFIQVKERISKLIAEGKLDQYTAQSLFFGVNKVLEGIAKKHTTVMEEVKKVMGGRILEYEAKDILRMGKAEGRAEGENQFAQLTRFLLQDHRYQDLEQAASDKQIRDELYQEYGMKPA